MKKNLLISLYVGLLLLMIVSYASASLIGDIVQLQHYYPDLDTPYGSSVTVTVCEGTSDAILVQPEYDVNIDAYSIWVNFKKDGRVWDDTSFNGLVIRDLNDSSGNVLQDVSIDTNLRGWDDSRLSFGPDSIFLNWQDLPFNSGSNLTAHLDFGSTNVPLPASVWLLSSGLGIYAGLRRMKKCR